MIQCITLHSAENLGRHEACELFATQFIFGGGNQENLERGKIVILKLENIPMCDTTLSK